MRKNLSPEPATRFLEIKKRGVPMLLPPGIGLFKGLAGVDRPVFTQPVKPRLIQLPIEALFKQPPRAEYPCSRPISMVPSAVSPVITRRKIFSASWKRVGSQLANTISARSI